MTKDEADVWLVCFVLAWIWVTWPLVNIFLAGEPESPIYLLVASLLPWVPRLR